MVGKVFSRKFTFFGSLVPFFKSVGKPKQRMLFGCLHLKRLGEVLSCVIEVYLDSTPVWSAVLLTPNWHPIPKGGLWHRMRMAQDTDFLC